MNEPTDPPGDVLRFTGKTKTPPDAGLMLVPPPAGCQHYATSFEVDRVGGMCKSAWPAMPR